MHCDCGKIIPVDVKAVKFRRVLTRTDHAIPEKCWRDGRHKCDLGKEVIPSRRNEEVRCK